MFSLIFPGQGSQVVGMCKDLYENFDLVKKLFNEANEILNFPISKIILEGPKDQLDLTENTQPAIFLVGYSIYSVMSKKLKGDTYKCLYFAGHSLGEYTALASAGYISFEDTIKILKIRGSAMQSSIPKGEGGMLAVLGSKIEIIEKLIFENKSNYECFVANDNSDGQIVVSGKNKDLKKFSYDLKKQAIKNIKLAVSAPFHCKLMAKATEIMKAEIEKLNITQSDRFIISNVTGKKTNNISEIKDLLIKQIESRVRWRESVEYMIENGTKNFIEIGPGKVLSGLIKRINKTVKVNAINTEADINTFKETNGF